VIVPWRANEPVPARELARLEHDRQQLTRKG
jgi:hypothetical protein